MLIPTSQDEQLVADWASVSVAFDEIASNERWLLYQRDRSVELPPPRRPLIRRVFDRRSRRIGGRGCYVPSEP